MIDKKCHLILASQSPRRKELLGHLEIPFKVIPSDVVEESNARDHVRYCQDLAKLKGQDILGKLNVKGAPSYLILSSDTIVCFENKVYGKPKDISEAREFLKKLSGQTHRVISSYYFCLRDALEGGGFEVYDRVGSCSTEVTFNEITNELLDVYLNTEDSLDKAGAYGIQGAALLFIKELRGSYSNVVGLPLSHVYEDLLEFMANYYGKRDNLRDYFYC